MVTDVIMIMTNEPRTITDNLDELLAILPSDLTAALSHDDRAQLLEIVLDLGRKPEARFASRYQYLREEPITREELQSIEARLGTFGTDNRAGIQATLHRISAMRNRRGEVIGLTMRVGRAVSGIVDILRDLIESGESILLMGRPGLGKTTLLREMARVLADEVEKRVVIVDTSNEIAGDGDVPHPAIGRARRMQVARVDQQHDVMIEAVENHMPEVVVIDEIGRIEETMAARTIAERGVQLVATAHGNTLDNLVANPTMSDLIGGIQAVTLSDEEARRRGTQKTVLERKSPPTFDVVVEMIERDQIAVRRPVADVVDALLRGHPAPPELRWRDENGDIHTEQPIEIEVQEHDFSARDHFADSGRDRNDRHGDRGGRGRNGNNRHRQGRFNERSNRRGGRRDETGGDSRERNDSRPSLKLVTGLDSYFTDNQAATVAQRYQEMISGKARGVQSKGATLVVVDDDPDEGENGTISDEERAMKSSSVPAPVDLSRVRSFYPFGVSRSRLGRAIKHLGLPLAVARRWQEADAILMLSGVEGLAESTALLREPRDLGMPIVSVQGNTYAEILDRLNDLYAAEAGGTRLSPKDLAMREAEAAVQRVLAEAQPVELRVQNKQMRRLQHQLAARFHLRSYSVGQDPNRRVRFLPSLAR